MKLLLKHISITFTLLLACCLGPNPAEAQVDSDADPSVPADYDPISATLDSLVSQTWFDRLSSVSQAGSHKNTFDNDEVPVYSDDVYAKRIAKIQTPIPLTFNDDVKQYIEMYAVRKRNLTERVMGLAKLYFPLYEQILDQQGLPLEFKYLSIVESALNPTAVSRVGATGPWQFMLSTGRLYNLTVNSYIDERRDPLKSTLAACQYFKDMYAIYNDWLLVVAAYNCGAGNVNRAIARSGGKHTFWEIAPFLPRETRGYVPAFVAVTYLMNFAPEHNLVSIPPAISYFEVDTVMVQQKVSLSQIAGALDIPIDLLKYLNPVYKKGVIPESREPMTLRLPSGKMGVYMASLDKVFNSNEQVQLAELDNVSDKGSAAYTYETVKKVHRVHRGEHLSGIADDFNCSVGELKKWNHLHSTRLRIGQRLTVYVTAKKKVPLNETTSVSVKATSSDSLKSQKSTKDGSSTAVPVPSGGQDNLKTVYHVVQPGDTLWDIAQQYDGVTVEQIKEINRLHSNNLKVGTKLKVVIEG